MTEPTPDIDFDTLLMGRKGAPVVSFPAPGAFVEGIVIDKTAQPKRKFNRNPQAPVEYETYKTGPNAGMPIQELVVTLQTDLNDYTMEGDDGKRRVFFPFQMQQELAATIKAAGGNGLPKGSWVRITYTHDSPSAGGGSPRKEYKVEYRAPADQLLTRSQPTTTGGGATTLSGHFNGQGGGPTGYIAPTYPVSEPVRQPVQTVAADASTAVPAGVQVGPELRAALQALAAHGGPLPIE